MRVQAIGVCLVVICVSLGCKAPDLTPNPGDSIDGRFEAGGICEDAESSHPDTPISVVPGDHPPVIWGQGRALGWSGPHLVATDTDNGALVLVSTAGQLIQSLTVGDRPEQVLTGPDGDVFASIRGEGRVIRVDGALTQIEADTTLGADVHGLAISVEGDLLFATMPAQGSLVALEPRSLSVMATLGGLDHPRAVLASPDGRLFVTTDSGEVVLVGVGNEEGVLKLEVASREALRDRHTLEPLFQFSRATPPVKRHAFGIAWRPGHDDVMVSHNLVHPGSARTTILSMTGQTPPSDCTERLTPGYYGSAPVLVSHQVTGLFPPIEPVISTVGGDGPSTFVKSKLVVDPSPSPLIQRELSSRLSMPSDIHHHPHWSMAFVTGFSSNNVLIYNTRHDDPMASPMGIMDVGEAPRGIVFSADGRTAYVLNGHDLSVSVVALDHLLDLVNTQPETMPATHLVPCETFSIGVSPLNASQREGRRLFTEARQPKLNSNNVFACVACHWEGGSDRIVWFGPEGPRRTTHLAGRLEDSAPFNWKGDEATLFSNIQRTISRLGGVGTTGADITHLEHHLLNGLPSPPTPHRHANGLTDSQSRGQALFEASCAGCHTGKATSDGRQHNIGTTSELEYNLDSMGMGHQNPRLFNTPVLRQLSDGGPYFHDGSAPTLHAVIEHKIGHLPEKVAPLGQDQINDLVDYLLTL